MMLKGAMGSLEASDRLDFFPVPFAKRANDPMYPELQSTIGSSAQRFNAKRDMTGEALTTKIHERIN
jgi:hypothetical protein